MAAHARLGDLDRAAARGSTDHAEAYERKRPCRQLRHRTAPLSDLEAAEEAVGVGDDEASVGIALPVIERVRTRRRVAELGRIDKCIGGEVVGVETL